MQEYLVEARRHNDAFGDAPNVACCLEVDRSIQSCTALFKDVSQTLLRAQHALARATQAVGGGVGFADVHDAQPRERARDRG